MNQRFFFCSAKIFNFFFSFYSMINIGKSFIVNEFITIVLPCKGFIFPSVFIMLFLPESKVICNTSIQNCLCRIRGNVYKVIVVSHTASTQGLINSKTACYDLVLMHFPFCHSGRNLFANNIRSFHRKKAG